MKEEKILWCETHDDSRWRSAFNTTAIDICSFAWEFQNPDPCRMVERVLGSPLSEAAVAKAPIAAAKLRNALNDPGFYVGEVSMEGPTDAWDIITDAAQNWLKVLEADPELEAVDWRAMFARYVNAWGMSEGVHNLGPGGWSFDEWKAIIELYYEVLVPEGWEPFPERWLQTTCESHPYTPEEFAAISTPTSEAE